MFGRCLFSKLLQICPPHRDQEPFKVLTYSLLKKNQLIQEFSFSACEVGAYGLRGKNTDSGS